MDEEEQDAIISALERELGLDMGAEAKPRQDVKPHGTAAHARSRLTVPSWAAAAAAGRPPSPADPERVLAEVEASMAGAGSGLSTPIAANKGERERFMHPREALFAENFPPAAARGCARTAVDACGGCDAAGECACACCCRCECQGEVAEALADRLRRGLGNFYAPIAATADSTGDGVVAAAAAAAAGDSSEAKSDSGSPGPTTASGSPSAGPAPGLAAVAARAAGGNSVQLVTVSNAKGSGAGNGEATAGSTSGGGSGSGAFELVTVGTVDRSRRDRYRAWPTVTPAVSKLVDGAIKSQSQSEAAPDSDSDPASDQSQSQSVSRPFVAPGPAASACAAQPSASAPAAGPGAATAGAVAHYLRYDAVSDADVLVALERSVYGVYTASVIGWTHHRCPADNGNGGATGDAGAHSASSPIYAGLPPMWAGPAKETLGAPQRAKKSATTTGSDANADSDSKIGADDAVTEVQQEQEQEQVRHLTQYSRLHARPCEACAPAPLPPSRTRGGGLFALCGCRCHARAGAGRGHGHRHRLPAAAQTLAFGTPLLVPPSQFRGAAEHLDSREGLHDRIVKATRDHQLHHRSRAHAQSVAALQQARAQSRARAAARERAAETARGRVMEEDEVERLERELSAGPIAAGHWLQQQERQQELLQQHQQQQQQQQQQNSDASTQAISNASGGVVGADASMDQGALAALLNPSAAGHDSAAAPAGDSAADLAADLDALPRAAANGTIARETFAPPMTTASQQNAPAMASVIAPVGSENLPVHYPSSTSACVGPGVTSVLGGDRAESPGVSVPVWRRARTAAEAGHCVTKMVSGFDADTDPIARAHAAADSHTLPRASSGSRLGPGALVYSSMPTFTSAYLPSQSPLSPALHAAALVQRGAGTRPHSAAAAAAAAAASVGSPANAERMTGWSGAVLHTQTHVRGHRFVPPPLVPYQPVSAASAAASAARAAAATTVATAAATERATAVAARAGTWVPVGQGVRVGAAAYEPKLAVGEAAGPLRRGAGERSAPTTLSLAHALSICSPAVPAAGAELAVASPAAVAGAVAAGVTVGRASAAGVPAAGPVRTAAAAAAAEARARAKQTRPASAGAVRLQAPGVNEVASFVMRRLPPGSVAAEQRAKTKAVLSANAAGGKNEAAAAPPAAEAPAKSVAKPKPKPKAVKAESVAKSDEKTGGDNKDKEKAKASPVVTKKPETKPVSKSATAPAPAVTAPVSSRDKSTLSVTGELPTARTKSGRLAVPAQSLAAASPKPVPVPVPVPAPAPVPLPVSVAAAATTAAAGAGESDVEIDVGLSGLISPPSPLSPAADPTGSAHGHSSEAHPLVPALALPLAPQPTAAPPVRGPATGAATQAVRRPSLAPPDMSLPPPPLPSPLPHGHGHGHGHPHASTQASTPAPVAVSGGVGDVVIIPAHISIPQQAFNPSQPPHEPLPLAVAPTAGLASLTGSGLGAGLGLGLQSAGPGAGAGVAGMETVSFGVTPLSQSLALSQPSARPLMSNALGTGSFGLSTFGASFAQPAAINSHSTGTVAFGAGSFGGLGSNNNTFGGGSSTFGYLDRAGQSPSAAYGAGAGYGATGPRPGFGSGSGAGAGGNGGLNPSVDAGPVSDRVAPAASASPAPSLASSLAAQSAAGSAAPSGLNVTLGAGAGAGTAMPTGLARLSHLRDIARKYATPNGSVVSGSTVAGSVVSRNSGSSGGGSNIGTGPTTNPNNSGAAVVPSTAPANSGAAPREPALVRALSTNTPELPLPSPPADATPRPGVPATAPETLTATVSAPV